MAKITMRGRAGQDVEIGQRPSKVFGTRLRELRKSRGWNQEQLAQRMTEVGYPMAKTTIVRLEQGERQLSLDEALALTRVLNGVFAQLLTPADGNVAVDGNTSYDGDALRSWLRTGDDHPSGFSIGNPFKGGREEQKAEIDEIVASRAQALVDAARNDDEPGKREAIRALVEVLDYRGQPEYRSYSREMLDREAAEARD